MLQVTLMDYQTKRGGKVVLQDITKPTRMEWGTPLEAVTAVLELEKTVTRTLQDLQAKAAEKNDFHLVDFIQQELLVRKVNTIKEVGDILTKVKRAGDGPGLYIVDRELEKAVINCTLLKLETVVNTRRNFQETGMVCELGEIVKEVTDCLAGINMA